MTMTAAAIETMPAAPRIARRRMLEHRRMNFLPRHCGRHYLTFENKLFCYARTLCPDYSGGFWHFYDLSNGGFYLALDQAEPMRIFCEGNNFDGSMSADAAGIVITLFVLCDMAGRSQKFADAYWALRDFADQHKETAAIRAAID